MKLCLSLLSNGDTEVTKPLARAKTLLESFQAAVEASSLEMTHSPEFQFVDTPPFRRVFLQGCSVSNVCSIYLYCDPERSLRWPRRGQLSFRAGSRSGQGWPHSPPACLTRNSSLALPIGAIPQQGVRKEVTRTRWLDCAQLCCRRSGIRHPKLGIKIPEADNHVFRP